METDEVIKDLEERLVGKGVANALQLFRERGMLNKKVAFGRNKDKTIESQLKSFGVNEDQSEDRVKLEYFDKKGKKLTLKEAFRQMCWKFHGKMPSHKSMEKRKRQEEDAQKQSQLLTNRAVPQSNLGSLAKKKTKRI